VHDRHDIIGVGQFTRSHLYTAEWKPKDVARRAHGEEAVGAGLVEEVVGSGVGEEVVGSR
jgi:hypothetical protein